MEELVNKIIECEFEYIPLSEFPLNERFGLIVNKNEVKYEFLIHINSDSNKLICLGSGALNGSDLERFELKPRFHRQSWDFEESTIFYNDPTRYLNKILLGGWGIGTPEEWYLENIKDIILKISNYFDYKNKDIIFYGSSLGGFMSIQLSTLVKDSLAIADVPQLTFENAKYWQYIKKILFPNFSDEEIYNNFKYRLNVLELIQKEKYIPNAILILDAGEQDINEHYIHFFRELNKITGLNNNLIKIVINPINEHRFLNMQDTLTIIKEACENNLLIFNNEIYSSKLYENNQILYKRIEDLELENFKLIEYLNKNNENVDFNKNNSKQTLIENHYNYSKINIIYQDQGLLNNHNDIWTLSNMSLVRTDEYTIIRKSNSQTGFCKLLEVPLNSIIEFDCLKVDGNSSHGLFLISQPNIKLYSNSIGKIGLDIQKWFKIKIIITNDGTCIMYSKDTNQTNIMKINNLDSQQKIQFWLWCPGSTTTLYLKNFMIYKL